MITTIAITINIPNPIPALKMLPIASQLTNSCARPKSAANDNTLFFMFVWF